MNRTSILLVLGALFVQCILVSGVTVRAESQELRQEISIPTCINVGDCPMNPPHIERITKDRGRLTVSGAFDPAFTDRLEVTFNQITYILGVDSELTAYNGQWSLDLGNVSGLLGVGVYAIIVSAYGYSGEILEDASEVSILEEDITEPSVVEEDGSVAGVLPSTGQDIATIAGVSTALALAGIVSLRVLRGVRA